MGLASAPTSSSRLPSLKMFSVSVFWLSSTTMLSTGSGPSSSVGSFTPGLSERSRLGIRLPSMISGPWIRSAVCGCAGNTWIGCDDVVAGV